MPHSKPQLSQPKICSKCKQEKPLSEFNRNRNQADGHRNYCKACQSDYHRAYYDTVRERETERSRAHYAANKKSEHARRRAWKKANPDKVAESAARMRAKYPDREMARKAVSHAVESGKMPSARDLPCSVCGKPAQHWHHHLGYAPEHWLDVIPVCIPCHTELHRS